METLPPLRDIIHQFDLAARKSLGQHFLLDLNLTRKIARIPGSLAGINVIEIGPGPGGLTRALIESDAADIFAYEKDQRCVAALQSLVALGKLHLQEADALKVDLTQIPAPRAIIANLPYNIGTELLFAWLEQLCTKGQDCYRHITIMLQKEVAERIVSTADTKAYGKLAVMTQWLCSARIAMHVPASAFTPPPKIDSSIVHLVPHAAKPTEASWAAMNHVVSAGFAQRRKMLRAALKAIHPNPEAWLIQAGIDPTRRAETLSIPEWGTLVRTYST